MNDFNSLKQAKKVRQELGELEPFTALSGTDGVDSDIREIDVLKTDLLPGHVFIRYQKLTAGDGDRFGWRTHYVMVDKDAKIDRSPQTNLKFDSYSDRTHFFNSLYPIKS